EPLAAAWWFVLPLLTAGGVVAAARARKTALVLVPTVVGLALAAPYLLLVGYAAPRSLLPAPRGRLRSGERLEGWSAMQGHTGGGTHCEPACSAGATSAYSIIVARHRSWPVGKG
ncbi:hypothetical protein ADK59_26695, partial [Streptomyces sp. XY332]